MEGGAAAGGEVQVGADEGAVGGWDGGDKVSEGEEGVVNLPTYTNNSIQRNQNIASSVSACRWMLSGDNRRSSIGRFRRKPGSGRNYDQRLDGKD